MRLCILPESKQAHAKARKAQPHGQPSTCLLLWAITITTQLFPLFLQYVFTLHANLVDFIHELFGCHVRKFHGGIACNNYHMNNLKRNKNHTTGFCNWRFPAFLTARHICAIAIASPITSQPRSWNTGNLHPRRGPDGDQMHRTSTALLKTRLSLNSHEPITECYDKLYILLYIRVQLLNLYM